MKINVINGTRFETEALTSKNRYATLSARGSTVELRNTESGDVIAHQVITTTPEQAVFRITQTSNMLN